MSKIQTRRTISFNRDLVERIKLESEADGVSTAQFVAELVRAELVRRGHRMPAVAYAPPRIEKRT